MDKSIEIEKIEKKSVKVTLDKRIIAPAQHICNLLGLPLDVAINVFLYQVVYTRSIPFPIVLPSDEVLERFDLYQKIAEAEEEVREGKVVPADEAWARIIEKIKRSEAEQNGD